MPEWKRIAQALPQIRKLRLLFDAEFYTSKYRDVAAAGVNPFRHYLEHGAFEGRKPNALFDPEYYLLRQAAASSELPVVSFLRQTGEHCPNPHPLFDCASYLHAYPHAGDRVNPLLHYLVGRHEAASAEGDPLPAGFEIVRFTFMDVPLAIAFVEEELSVAEKPRRDLVCIWEDSTGRTQFIAPPEQRPFFELMKYDQLRAQLEGRGERTRH